MKEIASKEEKQVRAIPSCVLFGGRESVDLFLKIVRNFNCSAAFEILISLQVFIFSIWIVVVTLARVAKVSFNGLL